MNVTRTWLVEVTSCNPNALDELRRTLTSCPPDTDQRGERHDLTVRITNASGDETVFLSEWTGAHVNADGNDPCERPTSG